jgi:hypothetical protein
MNGKERKRSDNPHFSLLFKAPNLFYVFPSRAPNSNRIKIWEQPVCPWCLLDDFLVLAKQRTLLSRNPLEFDSPNAFAPHEPSQPLPCPHLAEDAGHGEPPWAPIICAY